MKIIFFKTFLSSLVFHVCRSLPCMTLLDATWILKRDKSPSRKMVLIFIILFICVIFPLFWLLRMSGVDEKCQTFSCLLPGSPGFLPTGNDLGSAFEIPQHVKNQAFFASCVLKVSHQHKGINTKPTASLFMQSNCPSHCISHRMQNWSSTLEEKNLKMPLRVGLLPWTRHWRGTQSDLLRQVCGWNLVSAAAKNKKQHIEIYITDLIFMLNFTIKARFSYFAKHFLKQDTRPVVDSCWWKYKHIVGIKEMSHVSVEKLSAFVQAVPKWVRQNHYPMDPRLWSSSRLKNWLNKPSTMSSNLRNMWTTQNSGMTALCLSQHWLE